MHWNGFFYIDEVFVIGCTGSCYFATSGAANDKNFVKTTLRLVGFLCIQTHKYYCRDNSRCLAGQFGLWYLIAKSFLKFEKKGKTNLNNICVTLSWILCLLMIHFERLLRHQTRFEYVYGSGNITIIMGAKVSQITSLMIVYSIVYSDVDQRKHQSSSSLAFVRWIHRGPVNSPHKWPVTWKMFPFDDVIMSG